MCCWGVGCGTGRHESLGPCQEVLIPGTTCCPGAQPRDEVMEDRDSGSCARASWPNDVIFKHEKSLSAWKRQALSFLLLDNSLTPAYSSWGRVACEPCLAVVLCDLGQVTALLWVSSWNSMALRGPLVDTFISPHPRSSVFGEDQSGKLRCLGGVDH